MTMDVESLTTTTSTPRPTLFQGNIMSLDFTSSSSSSQASTSSSPTAAASTVSLEELDQTMFGDVNMKLADALTEFCAKAIQSGVESLPLLQEREDLLKKIGKPYLRNLDMIEAYGSRRIFTVKYAGGPKRRQEIVHRFLIGRDDDDNDNNNKKVIPSTTASSQDNILTRYPSLDEIPSKEMIQSVEAEVQTLITQLKEAKIRRDLLRMKYAKLQTTHEMTLSATETIQSSSMDIERLHEPISTAITGGQSLQDMIREGTNLRTILEERKKDVMNEDKHHSKTASSSSIPDLLPSTKRRLLTSEELYEQERQMVKVSRTGLASLLASSKKENVPNSF